MLSQFNIFLSHLFSSLRFRNLLRCFLRRQHHASGFGFFIRTFLCTTLSPSLSLAESSPGPTGCFFHPPKPPLLSLQGLAFGFGDGLRQLWQVWLCAWAAWAALALGHPSLQGSIPGAGTFMKSTTYGIFFPLPSRTRAALPSSCISRDLLRVRDALIVVPRLKTVAHHEDVGRHACRLRRRLLYQEKAKLLDEALIVFDRLFLFAIQSQPRRLRTRQFSLRASCAVFCWEPGSGKYQREEKPRRLSRKGLLYLQSVTTTSATVSHRFGCRPAETKSICS